VAAASAPHEGIVPCQDRIERARLLYERAVFGGDASALAIAETCTRSRLISRWPVPALERSYELAAQVNDS
jgi:hypothetical protein